MKAAALEAARADPLPQVENAAEHWVPVREFAAAARIDPRSAREVLAKRADGGRPWRSAVLRVRVTHAYGGPSGVRYEVALHSLPREVREAVEARRLVDAVERKVEQVALPAVVADAQPAEGAEPATPGAAAAETARVALYEERADWFSRQSPGVREEAARRVAWLLRIEDMAADTGLSFSQCAAKVRQSFAAEGPPSMATLHRWHDKIQGTPRHVWAYFIAPSWTGAEQRAECHPTALAMITSDYLRREAPTFRSCYRRFVAAATENGWPIPSEDTLFRRVNRDFGPEAIARARKGPDALKRFIPPQKRDRSAFHALQAVDTDGFDFHIYAVMEDGEIRKPCMVHWQCLFSNKILAWEIGPTEATELYRKSFARLVSEYGIPEHVHLDNTRAAANKTMTGGTPNRYRFKVIPGELLGIMPRLGVRVHWTTPGHGQAKPIERAHRDFRNDIEKDPALAGAYSKSGAVPIARLREVVAECIARYNDRHGRQGDNCAGRSFNQTFDESYSRHAHLIQRPTEEQTRLLLLSAAEVKTSRDSGAFKLYGNRYWSEELTRYAGRVIHVRFDPDNLHRGAYAYTKDDRFICLANCLLPVGFQDAAAGKEWGRQHKRLKKLTSEKLDLQRTMSIKEVAALIPRIAQPPLPAPKVRRGFFHPSGPEDLGAAPALDAPPATMMPDAFDAAVERAALSEKKFNPKAASS